MNEDEREYTQKTVTTYHMERYCTDDLDEPPYWVEWSLPIQNLARLRKTMEHYAQDDATYRIVRQTVITEREIVMLDKEIEDES